MDIYYSIIPIEVPRVDYERRSGNRLGETFASIRALVQAAHDIQNKRSLNGDAKNVVFNAGMRVGEVMQFCNLQPEDQCLARSAT